MKVVMDADCLIKLTKAGMKERVCAAWSIHIPAVVRRETTTKAPGLPDAVRIADNIRSGLVTVASGVGTRGKGEDAALKLFRAGKFDAIATDDLRFIRRLRGLGVPFAVPAVIVVRLYRAGVLSRTEADSAIGALAPLISPDERAVAELLLDGGQET
jgi:rRNA-processing protein FCF1